MALIKGLAVGIAALLLASILYVWIYFALFIRSKVPPGVTIGVDVRIFLASVVFWLVALLAFAAGFYWEFRRASR